jgi:hypothetical protein
VTPGLYLLQRKNYSPASFHRRGIGKIIDSSTYLLSQGSCNRISHFNAHCSTSGWSEVAPKLQCDATPKNNQPPKENRERERVGYVIQNSTSNFSTGTKLQSYDCSSILLFTAAFPARPNLVMDKKWPIMHIRQLCQRCSDPASVSLRPPRFSLDQEQICQ